MKIEKLIPFTKGVEIQLPDFENLHENYDVIIHIGAPKTGSSAIQNFLLSHREQLKDIGFYYPEHGLDENGISGGHSNLGLEMIENNTVKAETIFDTYCAEAKKENLTLLISAESLFNYPEKLKHITKDHRCKIISFFRDPSDSIYSNYNQGVKRHFRTITLETFYKDVLKSNSPFFSGKLFDKWSENYGKENIIVLGYDPIVLDKISIQEFFLNALGIDQPVIQIMKPKQSVFVNKSYTSAALELKRMLNFILDKDNDKKNAELDRFLQKYSDEYSDEYNIIDPTIQERVKKKFESSNNYMKKEYLLQINPLFLDNSMSHEDKKLSYTEVLADIFNILKKIRLEKRDLYDYLVECVHQILLIEQSTFEIITLAKWFDIDVDTTKNDYWFNKTQINSMANGKYKKVDFLREIAGLLKDRKNYDDAEKIIQQALKLRPNGPVIIKLDKEIKKLKRLAKHSKEEQ